MGFGIVKLERMYTNGGVHTQLSHVGPALRFRANASVRVVTDSRKGINP